MQSNRFTRFYNFWTAKKTRSFDESQEVDSPPLTKLRSPPQKERKVFPTLPTEIIAQIVKDAAQGGPRVALLSYCLVSRAFAAATSPELYRDVEFFVKEARTIPGTSRVDSLVLNTAIAEEHTGIGSDAKSLLHTLQTNSDLASLVRRLQITSNDTRDEDLSAFILTNVLRSCSNITSLRVNLSDYEGTGALLHCLEVVHNLRPTLATLRISSYIDPAELSRALSGRLAIKDLQVELYGDQRAGENVADRAAVKLTSLFLESDEEPITSALFDSFALSSAESLETLTVDLRRYPIDLSPFSKLRTLTLCKLLPSYDDDSEDEEEHPVDGGVFNLVATLRTANPCLEDLTLTAHWGHPPCGKPLFLLRLPPSLQSLDVSTYGSDPTILLAFLEPATSPHLRRLVVNGGTYYSSTVDLAEVIAIGAARGVEVIAVMERRSLGTRCGRSGLVGLWGKRGTDEE